MSDYALCATNLQLSSYHRIPFPSVALGLFTGCVRSQVDDQARTADGEPRMRVLSARTEAMANSKSVAKAR